jgi:hypothetical protein
MNLCRLNHALRVRPKVGRSDELALMHHARFRLTAAFVVINTLGVAQRSDGVVTVKPRRLPYRAPYATGRHGSSKDDRAVKYCKQQLLLASHNANTFLPTWNASDVAYDLFRFVS